MMTDSIMKLANKCITVSFQFCCEFQPKTRFVKPVIAFWKFTTDPLGFRWCSVIRIIVFAPPFLKKVTIFWIIIVHLLVVHVRFRSLGRRCCKVGKVFVFVSSITTQQFNKMPRAPHPLAPVSPNFLAIAPCSRRCV